jgi:hypothetical protein
MTTEGIVNFVNQFKEGKLENNFIASEPSDDPPADNSGPIKTVVGRQYVEITGDKTKDVIVLFWISDNDEVDKVLPHYKALAEHVKNVDDLVVGMYDVRTNTNKELSDQVEKMEETIKLKYSKVPVILFYPKGKTHL